MSTALYCPRHNVVERLTGRQLEDLISGLRYELGDAEYWALNDDMDGWCPTELVETYRDEELFAEFLADTRGERLAAAKRAREEYRRVGGGEAQRYQTPDHRGDGIRRAADLIRAGAPVGQLTAVIRDAAAAHIKPLFDVMQPASQVTVSRTLSMLPEAVELAGQVVELPPAASRTAAEDFEDLVDRDAGRPARERRHRGHPVYPDGTFDPRCSICRWSPQDTAHVRTGSEAAQAIRRAHNPNGEDD